MGWAMMISGLLIALAASALLLMNVIESGVAAAIGILGIGLIAASGRWLPTQKGMQPQAQPDVPTIHSPDRQLRALIKHRVEGTYQIEIQKLVHDYSPDVGSHDRWERQPDTLIVDSLATAVEIAAERVGAGTDDFFGKEV
jgi:hypothetical protein